MAGAVEGKLEDQAILRLNLNDLVLKVLERGTRGRGVFACSVIAKGTLVEHALCIAVPAKEYQEHVRYSVFENYLFTGLGGEHLLALGIASLFNHSSRPSLDYTVNKVSKTVIFRAARDIQEDEELTFFYGSKLWFEDDESRPPENGEGMSHDHMDDEGAFIGGFSL